MINIIRIKHSQSHAHYSFRIITKMISILLVAITIITLFYIFVHKSRSNRLLDEFPTPKDIHKPFLGIIPFFLNCPRTELLHQMSSWFDRHGPIVRLWSPFGSAVMIADAAIAEKLLSSPTNLTKGFDYDFVRPWLGDGLLLSTGAKWGRRRKMLTPAFHFKILEDFMQVFNAESIKMVEIMKKECLGKTFDIHDYVTRCALDIICETAMGTSINAQDVHDSAYIHAINEFGRLASQRSFRPWLRFEPLYKMTSIYKEQQKNLQVLHGFTEKVIAERKARFQSPAPTKTENDDENIYFKSKTRLAFLDLLLQVQQDSSNELTDQDIREETDTFMFEGHDTTSASASFTLFALGCYPEIQEKCYQEQTSIFGDDKNRHVTNEDLTRMKYLECVIKESLRVYPAVPFIQRMLTSDVILDDGRTLPSGLTAGIFLYKMHKDPKAFPDPEKFLPERFETHHDPFAYVPFSAGPRNCIGQKFAMMEEKVIISNVLRNFKITANNKPEELKLVSEMILRSENGLGVGVKKR